MCLIKTKTHTFAKPTGSVSHFQHITHSGIRTEQPYAMPLGTKKEGLEIKAYGAWP